MEIKIRINDESLLQNIRLNVSLRELNLMNSALFAYINEVQRDRIEEGGSYNERCERDATEMKDTILKFIKSVSTD